MGRRRRSTRRHFATGVVLVAALAAASLPAAVSGTAGAVRSVRGFDGTTVKVAGIGIQSQFAQDPLGARARIKRFNDTNEIKGVKIDYDGVRRRQAGPGDGADGDATPRHAGPACSRSSVTCRRATRVTTSSSSTCRTSDCAFDSSYCSPKPDKTLYGFGFNGCLVPTNPSVMPDTGKNLVRAT